LQRSRVRTWVSFRMFRITRRARTPVRVLAGISTSSDLGAWNRCNKFQDASGQPEPVGWAEMDELPADASLACIDPRAAGHEQQTERRAHRRDLKAECRDCKISRPYDAHSPSTSSLDVVSPHAGQRDRPHRQGHGRRHVSGVRTRRSLDSHERGTTLPNVIVELA
jgi:hypothetical protein